VIAAVREERVKSLVYISALAPDEGETVAKVFYRDKASAQQPKMVPDSHGLVWMPESAFRRALAQNATVDQVRVAAAVQRPIAVHCIQQPAPTPLWKSKPSWYLLAEEDRSSLWPSAWAQRSGRIRWTTRPCIQHRIRWLT